MSENINLDVIEADFTKTLVSGSIKGAMKAVGAGSRDLWQCDPAKLRIIEGLNPRVMNAQYKAHIRALADSMLSEGYYQDQPLAGYVDEDENVFVYSGHSRLLAVALAIKEGAEIPRVPVTISQVGLSMEDITVALIRGNSGKNLTFYESAVVCKRLVQYGYEMEEISKRTGIALPLVKNRMALMAAPKKLREMVADEIVSATLAIEMITLHGGKALEKIQEAMEVAATQGKSRVLKAQTVKADVFDRAKYVKKAAPKLYEAAAVIRDDPGYASLSEATRELLESLLAEIQGKSGEEKPEIDVRQKNIEDIA